MDHQEIDHNLYSRQIGAYGLETMLKLAKTRVLLLGLSGVGLEIAKNLILAGPKSVVIFDNKITQEKDLEWNYYLNKENIGKNSAETVLGHLQELNSYVKVAIQGNSIEDFINIENLKDFDVVVVADFYPK